MAKNGKIFDENGDLIYPLTVSTEVKDPVTGQTVKTQIDALNTELTRIGPDLVQVKNRVTALENASGSGNGLSREAVALLMTILLNGVYETNQNANIVALGTELGYYASEITIEQSGTTLTITGVNSITSVAQSGTTLTLS